MLTGAAVDLPGYTQAAKSRAVYLVLTGAITGCWVCITIVQARLSRLGVSEEPFFEVGESGQVASALAVYMLFFFLYEALQTYLYWLMGEVHAARGGGKAEADSQQQQEEGQAGEIARTTGILRSWEGIENTIVYVVGAAAVSNMKQLVPGFVLWGFTLPFTLWAIYGEWTPVKGDKEVVVHGGSDGEDEHSRSSVGGEDIKGQVLVVDGERKS